MDPNPWKWFVAGVWSSLHFKAFELTAWHFWFKRVWMGAQGKWLLDILLLPMFVDMCNDSFADSFICICSQIWTPVEGVFSCKLIILIDYWKPFWRGANQPMDVSHHYYHNELKQKMHHFCEIGCYWASVTGREMPFISIGMLKYSLLMNDEWYFASSGM